MKTIYTILTSVLLITLISNLFAQKDWTTAIDTTWGNGLPTVDKLQIFDLFWETIDEDYAGFHNLDVNWDSLRNVYRPEVVAGVSRGRFSAIMDQLHLALMEMHTHVYDVEVRETNLEPGVPLLVFWSAIHVGDNGHFGAGLIPLPDSSALVYKVIDNHPLGLEPGDIVLGYEGILWKYLYQNLLAAELPVTTSYEPYKNIGLGSSDRSVSHIWLMSVGLNWHLFDTIDILKYGTDDTLHLPTNVLTGLNEQLICTEQMPIPGVNFPDFANLDKSLITYGMVDGTQIGYIYAGAWQKDLGDGAAFTNAVNTLIDVHQVAGLIIDCRANLGGQFEEANGGFSRLFNFDLAGFEFAERSDPEDHFAMQIVSSGYCSGDNLEFNADPYLYDRPIAVLTGPSTVSAGDYNSRRLKFHPMVRFFGKQTNTAYTCFASEGYHNLEIHSGWLAGYAPRNVYVSDDPDNYLMHVGFEVDEDIWLTQEDVVKGEDTVVKRAMEWINNLAYAHDVTVNKTYAKTDVDSVLVSATVENINQHELSVEALIKNESLSINDTIAMFDDGMHGDNEAGDNLWSNFYTPSGEQLHTVSVTTTDNFEGSSRTLPNVSRFTSCGPIKINSFQIISSDTIPNHGDRPICRLSLINEGISSMASDISVQLTSLDTCSRPLYTNLEYGDINPGAVALPGQDFRIIFYEDCPDSIITEIKVEIYSGLFKFWSDTFSIFVHKDPLGLAKEEEIIPKKFTLNQNYPNPFNPKTIINYELPIANEVELSIYNLIGQKVVTLVLENQKAGYHQAEWDASGFASGIYYYKITAGEFQDVKKMILLR